jgi:two-component system, cell cycle sensor histidine kinase and response regulator CckA
LNKPRPHTKQADELRQRAEAIARERANTSAEDIQALSPGEAHGLIHELRVHQIELEMQNEELRRAQGALEVSRARYFDLYDLAPVGYCTLSKPSLIQEANLTAATLLGTNRGALVGQSLTRFVLRAHQDIYYQHRRLLFEVGGTQACELQMVRQDGTPFWARLESTVTRDADGFSTHRVAMTDISDRRRTEAEREQLMTAIEQAAEAVVITDPQGTILYLNPAFEAATGYTRDEARGKNPRILKSGKQDEAFYRGLWETIAAGRTWSGRMVNRRKDGTLYTEQATISPVRDGAGTIINYVAVKRDITVELQLEEQYRQAQKMESVGRLAGGVAHDFNNMLGVILGYAEMAMERIDPAQPLHVDLDEIRKAAQRSAALTRQLLAYARKQAIVPVVMSLNDTIDGSLNMLRRLIGENIELAWVPSPRPWLVRMDPAQIDHILANLLVNACDAIGDAGKIVIETDNVKLDAAACADHADRTPGEYVVLSVQDDGCGMTATELASIFDPFYTTKAIGKGTGLGLATVYGAVNQSSGFIDVSSAPGRGTTFRIHLPRSKGTPAEQAAEGPQGVAVGGDETILLVDDEATLLKLAKIALERLGYTVLAVDTPEEAMRVAGQHAGAIDLLVTDVAMPGMSGLDLAHRLAESRPQLRPLFMSGYAADIIEQDGELKEGVHFIRKPFSVRELAVAVRGAIDAAAGRPEHP